MDNPNFLFVAKRHIISAIDIMHMTRLLTARVGLSDFGVRKENRNDFKLQDILMPEIATVLR